MWHAYRALERRRTEPPALGVPDYFQARLMALVIKAKSQGLKAKSQEPKANSQWNIFPAHQLFTPVGVMQ
jgi:hypothetical protein